VPPTPAEARQLALALSKANPDLAALISVDATTGMRRGSMRGAWCQACPDAFVWSQVADHSEPWRPDRVSGAFTALRNRENLFHICLNDLRHFRPHSLSLLGLTHGLSPAGSGTMHRFC
jgi:hypothetical protein